MERYAPGEVGALRARVAGLEEELAGVRGKVKVPESEARYCRMAGQVHESTSKSAHKLAEKLSGEKRALQKEVDRLVAGKVLNGRDKGTRMPAPPEPRCVLGLGCRRSRRR